jgi:hypothetical protein
MSNEEIISIDVLDKRLTDDGIEWYCEWTKGGDPNRRLLVDGNKPLAQFFEEVKSRMQNRKLGVLSLLAHGYGEWEYSDKTLKKTKQIHGGFGMEFCKEGITLDTVDSFKALKGLFKDQEIGIIKLMGCAMAAESQFRIYPNGPVKEGFGRKLCSKLANVTGVSVMASDALQSVNIDRNERTYRWGSDIRTIKACAKFGDWEGNVWIFRPDGKIDKINPLSP